MSKSLTFRFEGTVEELFEKVKKDLINIGMNHSGDSKKGIFTGKGITIGYTKANEKLIGTVKGMGFDASFEAANNILKADFRKKALLISWDKIQCSVRDYLK